MPYPTKKLGEISNVLPKQMVSAFVGNPPVQAKTVIDKHYIGLWIKASGKIESIHLALNYTTFSFRDKDGIYISANFFKPMSGEVSLLNKDMPINLIGQVFNVAEHIVVLDYCELVQEGEESAIPQLRVINKPKWWEKTSVQMIFLLGAIAGIIGLLSLFK